ncbi:MAG: GPR endopeptidase [Dethiobacteria bacterium]
MSCTPDHQPGYIPRYNIRTDLAVEAHDVLTREVPDQQIPGVERETEVVDEGITVTRMKITSPEGARSMGKAQGRYITIEAPGLRQKDTLLQEKVSQVLARELRTMLSLGEKTTTLVVGLGNWNVTPDALGPRVTEDTFVTRHIMQLQPEALGEGFRPVCALAPGVLGITGIETSEIIQGIVEKIKPDLLIVIDALAAHRVSRLHTTVQISDSGINPGSGVGNRRLGINAETMGIPVIALGVPTVVDASTIVGDALEELGEAFRQQGGAGISLAQILERMDRNEKLELIKEVLEPYSGGRLIVTPKEIDTLIEDISLVISGGINAALHPKVEAKDAGKYLH